MAKNSIFMKRTVGDCLKPADNAAQEAIKLLPTNTVIKITTSVARNYEHGKKWFKLLDVVFPAQDAYPTKEKFRKALMCAVGFCDVINLPDGRLILVADSVASMGQKEFQDLYDQSMKYILEVILPGTDRADIEREVMEILS